MNIQDKKEKNNLNIENNNKVENLAQKIDSNKENIDSNILNLNKKDEGNEEQFIIKEQDKKNKLLERLNKGKKVGNEKIREEENEREKGKLKIKEKANQLEEGLLNFRAH